MLHTNVAFIILVCADTDGPAVRLSDPRPASSLFPEEARCLASEVHALNEKPFALLLKTDERDVF